MAELVGFLTSKTGAFAAIVAVIGLVAAIAGLVRPMLERRRAGRDGAAAIAITGPELSELSRSSNAYELRFLIANSGGSAAVATAVSLRVLARAPSASVVPSVTEAPLRVNQHRVKFAPGKDVYDVRARAFSPAAPPLAFAEGEAEAFVVKLVADQPERLTIRVEVEWYAAKRPSELRTAASAPVEVDFPRRSK